MATSLLLILIAILFLPRLGDARHAHWHVGHGTSRQLGQVGRDGLIPDKFDGIPRETHNIILFVFCPIIAENADLELGRPNEFWNWFRLQITDTNTL